MARLYEAPIDKPLDGSALTSALTYRAKLKTQGAQGRVYLEMRVRVPGVGEAFSRGLTLVIVGDFELGKAKKLVYDNFGKIERPGPSAGASIAWEKVPRRQTVHWDAKVSGVCLAFPPPADRESAAAMSLFGTLLMQQLSFDAEIKRVAEIAFCTNHAWKAGPLPFFVYAAAKEGKSLKVVEEVLKTRFRAISAGAKSATAQLPLLISQLQNQPASLSRQMVQRQAQLLQDQRGMTNGRAVGMIVTQAALNWAMLDQLLGPEPDKTAEQVKAMAGARLNKLIDDTLDEKRMIVTYVAPAN